jgi:lipopolysaccharide export LptBFGC system permease protein LptF
MLVCFGTAWPFSIYKSYTSKQNGGKSIVFLLIVFGGYVSGIIHKLRYSYDPVIYLYITNAVLVAIDIALYYRNVRLKKYGKLDP